MVQRVQRTELEDTHAELGKSLDAEPEHAQRIEHLLHVVTAGDDAQPGVVRVGDELVERIGGDVALRPLDPVTQHLDLQGVGERHTDMAAERRRPRLAIDLERRQHRMEAGGIDLGHPRTVSDRRRDLHRDPKSCQPRHREGVCTEIEDLLHRSRIQNGQVQRDKRWITARRQRRRLRGSVVADQQHDAALSASSTETAVTDRVAGAIEAR